MIECTFNTSGCTITPKAKIIMCFQSYTTLVFWHFFCTLYFHMGPLCLKKYQKTLILAFEANSALFLQLHFFPDLGPQCSVLRTMRAGV